MSVCFDAGSPPSRCTNHQGTPHAGSDSPELPPLCALHLLRDVPSQRWAPTKQTVSPWSVTGEVNPSDPWLFFEKSSIDYNLFPHINLEYVILYYRVF